MKISFLKALREAGVRRFKETKEGVEIEFGLSKEQADAQDYILRELKPQQPIDWSALRKERAPAPALEIPVVDDRERVRPLVPDDDVPGGDDFAPDLTEEQRAKAQQEEFEATLFHSAD